MVLLAVLAAATPVAAQRARPAAPAAPAPAPAPAAPSDAKKEEAKARFERGMTLFDKKVWDAALVEFLASRSAFPTRSNTQNAAICLRNLNRFDEALDMFEALVKDFPNLAPTDKSAVEKEIAELQQLVGAIEIRAQESGAQITIDGRERGTTPAPPLRVAAGTHVLRVYKDGFAPVEKRVAVAGKETLAVEAKLETLSQSGRLSVTEDGGKGAEVLVDNVVVGRTPWAGLVATGEHVVFLRGEGNLGTQPANATVRINQVTPIVLALETLDCSLRVEPTPSGASVAVDGVVVGNGLWDGRLREGATQDRGRAGRVHSAEPHARPPRRRARASRRAARARPGLAALAGAEEADHLRRARRELPARAARRRRCIGQRLGLVPARHRRACPRRLRAHRAGSASASTPVTCILHAMSTTDRRRYARSARPRRPARRTTSSR